MRRDWIPFDSDFLEEIFYRHMIELRPNKSHVIHVLLKLFLAKAHDFLDPGLLLAVSSIVTTVMLLVLWI